MSDLYVSHNDLWRRGDGSTVARVVTPTDPGGGATDYTMPSGVIIPAGFENPSTVGLAVEGIAVGDLTPSGSITTTANGQIIEGRDISGGINVAHDGVIIRNNRITYSGTAQAVRGTGSGAGANAQVYNNIIRMTASGNPDVEGVYLLPGANVHHNDISGFADGLTNLFHDAYIGHNVFHDQYVVSGDHADCFQYTSGNNWIAERNTFLAFKNGEGAATLTGGVWRIDPGSTLNAVCQLGSQTNTLTGWHFRYNYVSGGYYCLNANATKEAEHGAITGAYYGNTFSGYFKYGPIAGKPGGVTFDNTNVWEATRDTGAYNASTGVLQTIWHCVEGEPVNGTSTEPA